MSRYLIRGKREAYLEETSLMVSSWLMAASSIAYLMDKSTLLMRMTGKWLCFPASLQASQ
jgi:hypothetical protein